MQRSNEHRHNCISRTRERNHAFTKLSATMNPPPCRVARDERVVSYFGLQRVLLRVLLLLVSTSEDKTKGRELLL